MPLGKWRRTLQQKDFFATIRSVWLDKKLNVTKMTLKEWYYTLLDKNVTMVGEEEADFQYIPARAELANMETDWEITWRRVRLQGLGSQMISFLWRLCHRLLPTQQRLSHFNPGNVSPLCKPCLGRNREEIGTLKHELIECPENENSGIDLLQVLRLHAPGLTADQILRLEFGNLDENLELPLTFFTASTLLEIWTLRSKCAKARRHLVRAKLEARIALLRTTRHSTTATILEDIMKQLPIII